MPQREKLVQAHKKVQEQVERLRPKHYRAKLTAALIMLALVTIGFNFHFFAEWGVFDVSHRAPEIVNSGALEKIGIDPEELEGDIEYLVVNMNSAQQGAHFLFGMISGLIFSQPTAGLTVGLIKEAYDLFTNYRASRISTAYLIDAGIDTMFWFAGGFIGFYVLSALYDIFHQQGIHGPRDLVLFLSRRLRRFLRRKEKEITAGADMSPEQE